MTIDPVMFVRVKQNPLNAVKECKKQYKSLRQGIRAETYQLLGTAAEIARRLRKSPQKWNEFCQQPFWTDRNPIDRMDAVRHVIVYIVDAARGTLRYKRAMKYATVVNLLLKRGIKPLDLPEELKKGGGIEKLLGTRERKIKGKAMPRQPQRSDTADETEEKDIAPSVATSKTIVLAASGKVRRALRNLKPGEKARLTVEKNASDQNLAGRAIKLSTLTRRASSHSW